ncbi:hypothetical protein KCM76_17145 [Zooshikella marina]|uniref:phage baseplate assembly protein V n=1 Tax=Zooshikella ganghwensis TaxID=202772 RepID=UPI001BB052F4|nr:phage baseplate assembly protein V [Zooshikella ganghwensis]MBU2707722.1 hypothetical protein [Zooshikella ganghwensis]
MVDAIKRIVLSLFPELAGNYHLPRYGRVVAISDTPKQGDLCDDFRPHYAVDVEVLDAQGKPDKKLPILHSLMVPMASAGQEQGFYGLPEVGTQVVVGFAYGLPNKPFIQHVLPHGLSLPGLEQREQRWQQHPISYQRCDQSGAWERLTDTSIKDECQHYQLETIHQETHTQSQQTTIAEHSTETIGGSKTLEAMGALKLHSGGTAELAAIDNLKVATGNDSHTVVGKDMQEHINGIKHSLAKLKQITQVKDGGKVWLGNESDNVLQLLSEFMAVVEQAFLGLSTHDHTPAGPTNKSDLLTQAGNTHRQNKCLQGML